jgi:ribosomal protein S18 acetylase RimI-like enzyme
MELVFDAWLSETMPYSVYVLRLTDKDDGTTISREVIPLLARPPTPYMAHTRLPVASVAPTRSLTRAGFYVVDTLLTFGRRLARTEETVLPPDIVIRPAEETDRAAIMQIAEHCFTFSRFHLDPGIPNPVADAINRRWVDDYFDRRRGIRLYGAFKGGEAVGFNAMMKSEKDGRATLVWDLMGVTREAQGHGIGKAFVSAFTRDYASDFDRVKVGTQVSNTRAIRLYERTGFLLESAAYVLHYHQPGPEREVSPKTASARSGPEPEDRR